MKLNKLVAGTTSAILLAAITFGVWAACGDAECGWVGETYVCVVQTPDGPRGCTEDFPCSVSCP